MNCGNCGKPIKDHPKSIDGLIYNFGVRCPYPGKFKNKLWPIP